jgi:4'-phosphopantetheinyl transferase
MSTSALAAPQGLSCPHAPNMPCHGAPRMSCHGAPRMSFCDDHVIIRWLPLDVVTEKDWPGLKARLPADELAQAARLRQADDRQSYIAAHALLRTLICRYEGGDPTDWRIVPAPGGKPRIVTQGSPPPLRFNLSHTRGLVAVAMARKAEIGLDVEIIRAGAIDLDAADQFFSPSECAALHACAPARRLEAAFALWTLKEAFLKSLGLGLHTDCPLDAFDIHLDGPLVTRAPAHTGDPSHWMLHTARPTDVHVLAMALRRVPGTDLRVDSEMIGREELHDG